jgi:hypothetical protein
VATHHGALSKLRGFGREGVQQHKLIIALPVAVSLLVATSLPASASAHPLLTPSQVAGVVSTFSVTNNRANATLSYADQAKDEEGTALALDDESFVLDRRAGYKTLDGAKFIPFVNVPFSTALEKGADYPATFATLVTGTSRGETPAMKAKDAKAPSLFVFSRSNASSAWRLSFEPTVSASIGKFAIGKKGYAMSPRTSGLAFAPAQIPDRVVAAIDDRAVLGTLVKGLTASDFTTTDHAWSIWNVYQVTKDEIKYGDSWSWVVKPDSTSDLHTFAMKTGDVLVTFSLMITVKYSAPNGEHFVNKNVSGQPDTWYIVGNGNYVSVTRPVVCELVALDTPAHGKSVGNDSIPALVGADCGYIAGTKVIR